MKTKRKQRREELLHFAFIDGMLAWTNKEWNPPRNPELFKQYAQGYDYVFIQDYK